LNALTLAERELRAASKRASTYWSRFGFAFVGAAVGAVMLYVAEQGGPLFASAVLVRTWSMFLFIFLLVRGVKLTAD